MIIDIAKISIENRGFFASAYEIAGEIFECDPVYADEKTKKKIASWIYKTYLSASDEIFDEDLLKYLRVIFRVIFNICFYTAT